MIKSRELAEMMQVTPECVRLWVRKGQIPAMKVAGTLFFDEDELAEFLKSRRVGLQRAS